MTEKRPTTLARGWRHLRRQGVVRTVKRALNEIVARHRNPTKLDYSHLPSAGIRETGRERVHCHLDTPLQGHIESSATLRVSGWAAARAGIEKVEVFVDGRPAAQLEHGRARPDVAEFLGHINRARSSGFEGAVAVGQLSYGPHRVEVVVRDGAGHTRVLTVVVRTIESAVLYDAYYRARLPSQTELRVLRGATGKGPHVVIWVDARTSAGVRDTVASLRAQIYANWHAVVICDEQQQADLADITTSAQGNRMQPTEFARAEALGAPSADPDAFSAFLQAGEVLAAHALAALVRKATGDDLDIVYSDRDSLASDGRHVYPGLNPDWSPDYFLGYDYVGGFYLFRDRLRPGLFKSWPAAPAWRYDALLRLTDRVVRVGHVAQLLWSSPEDHGPLVAAAEIAAVRDALERRGEHAQVEAGDDRRRRRIRWHLDREPLVSIVIPTTGRLDLVKTCLDSLIERTAYANYELIFLDNSRGKNTEGIAYLAAHGCTVVERNEDFNWARLNNAGVSAARGELLLFLNDDIEVVESQWLNELVALAVRDGVGCVGAMLLYPDGLIQHAGVFIVGYGGGAVHLFQGLDPAAGTYRDLHRIEREVSAVTGACLLVKRALFEAAGGFDESLEIAGNDIDLCLRLAAKGHRTLWTPHSVLIHHESASRSDKAIVGDETRMWQRWGDLLRSGDPYHSAHFAKDRVDCALDARKVRLEDGWRRHPQGVNLIGYIRAEMGVGEATRGTAAALDASGLAFTIIDYQHGNPSRMGDDSWAGRVSENAIYDINLVYVNADLTVESFARLPRGTFDGRYTIGAWTWELPDFPDAWLPAFNLVNEVWVPSSFVQDAIAFKSPVPLIRMPHVVRLPQGPFASRQELGLPADAYLFLTMYDLHSVRQRKNPEGAIDAFSRAFDADNRRVGLVIKMNNADRRERELIATLIADRPNVHVIDKTVDRFVVDSLMAATDSFVSLHRSEGFGLAIAEAMSLGRPVIATDWSGNVDYMDGSNSCPIGYSLVELPEDFGPYRAGQKWAEPDVENAAWWMRKLANDPAGGARIGARAARSIEDDFSADAIGSRIRRRLEVVERQRQGGSARRVS